MENETSGASEESREVKTSWEFFMMKKQEYHGSWEEQSQETTREQAKKEQRKIIGHNLLQQVNSNDGIGQGILEIGSLLSMNSMVLEIKMLI